MYVAIMGYGVVGSGVAELLAKNHDSIVKKSTLSQLDLKYILDLRDFPGDPFEDKVTKDFQVILNDPEVGIVVETMGGLHPAYDFVLALLQAGKSVVTSNKELVAEKGDELLRVAEEKNVNFMFEASVGGCVPIIRPIIQCLAANDIQEVAGILNGTTNFILTRMIDDNMTFADALKLAQANGYAEKDPTADVEGLDACRKICILASLCFGKHVYPKEVVTQGITGITLGDVEYAGDCDSVIKLIGRAGKTADGKVYATVSPAVLNRHSQLACANGVLNAIMVRGDATGDVVFNGAGAGKLPTASAVLGDVIDCAQHAEKRKVFGWESSDAPVLTDIMDLDTKLYVRAAVNNDEAVQAVEAALPGVKFLHRADAPAQELAFITGTAPRRALCEALEAIPGLQAECMIPVLDY